MFGFPLNNNFLKGMFLCDGKQNLTTCNYDPNSFDWYIYHVKTKPYYGDIEEISFYYNGDFEFYFLGALDTRNYEEGMRQWIKWLKK